MRLVGDSALQLATLVPELSQVIAPGWVHDHHPAGEEYPFLAQPLLDDRVAEIRLSQTPAILMYLGRKHGLIVEPLIAPLLELLEDVGVAMREVFDLVGVAVDPIEPLPPADLGRTVRGHGAQHVHCAATRRGLGPVGRGSYNFV